MPLKKSKQKRRSHKNKTKFPRPANVGPAFDRLVGVMNRLRAPGGCPWDREQTHATLRTYLIEEAYEVLDALENADDAKFAEELGDLLLQILFHSQIASEESRFTIADVIREIYEKMIRRHPHVFGEQRAKDAAEVLRNWEIIKRQEREKKEAKEVGKGEGKGESPADSTELAASSRSSSSATSPSILDGVPRSLPALVEALQLTRKAARIGFDWDSIDGIFDKLGEETHELRAALGQADGKGGSRETAESSTAIESEIGDLLFAAVNLARFLNVDPEIALKNANAKFSRRFHEMERLARAKGSTLPEVPRLEMESLWDQAKRNEKMPTPVSGRGS